MLHLHVLIVDTSNKKTFYLKKIIIIILIYLLDKFNKTCISGFIKNTFNEKKKILLVSQKSYLIQYCDYLIIKVDKLT